MSEYNNFNSEGVGKVVTEDSDKKKMKKIGIGAIIAAIVVLLIVLIVYFPSIVPFLNDGQVQAINIFRETYITPYSPIKGSGNGFDWMKVLALAIALGTCWVVNTILQLIIRNLKFKSRNAKTVQTLLANIVKYAIIIYAILYCLSILGVNMAAIVASLGIFSLIIGFGAQSLIEDVITGLFIILEGQLHVDDIVSIDGFRGIVTSIGIRTIQIKDDGGNIMIVNNSNIGNLVNLSESASLAVTTIQIAYEEDLENAEQVIKDCLANMPNLYPDIFKTVPMYLGVEEVGDDAVTFLMAAAVDEANIYMGRRLMNKELKLALDRAGIEDPMNDLKIVMEEPKK